MKVAKFIATCICVIGFTQPASCPAQSLDRVARKRILGYFDPQTGAFKPMTQVVPADPGTPPPVAATTGKFVFDLTINLPNHPNTTRVCSATAEVLPHSAANDSYFESASTPVPSSSSGGCTVTIAYSWALSAASTDSVVLTYTVVENFSSGSRASSHTITIKVPANGATTTENFTVVL